ncbi:hypothetical protein SAMN04487770_13730 [Butyrivibrio sp. ob235]|uniref:hypothetical protein n=1 Tax=Butyrivibrio sp. ob235 TaxID=1761780 RepID=UPI0008BA8635|nr:hypothetical protein [Butyrivibrio sp. ob235]SEM41072.1 hypothetical protein SAMN04487770_13730 [Butyrivibrio sp. ob235]
MMKLSRIGAAALAVALSFTLLTPVGVKAAQGRDYYTNDDMGDDPSVIDTYTKKITVTGDNSEDIPIARKDEKATLAAWNNAVAQGIAVAGTENSYNVRVGVLNTSTNKTEYTYFKYANKGYSLLNPNNPEYEMSADNKTVTRVLRFTYTEYKNNITGEMAYDEYELAGGNRLTETPNYIPVKKTLHTGDYGNITVLLDAGNVEIRNINGSLTPKSYQK